MTRIIEISLIYIGLLTAAEFRVCIRFACAYISVYFYMGVGGGGLYVRPKSLNTGLEKTRLSSRDKYKSIAPDQATKMTMRSQMRAHGRKNIKTTNRRCE